MTLNDKIKLIIGERNLTPSHFADEIGVQRSSISHILSGRNRPSLELVQKIITRFPDLTYEWLLAEPQGDAHVNPSAPFFQPTGTPNRPEVPVSTKPFDSSRKNFSASKPAPAGLEPTPVTPRTVRSVEKILIFYTDKTFTEYTPGATN